jgi:mannose/cellobiose epimerase-like protein (N-acyl-D-glucosamine 2-epimerase family)
VSAVESHRRWDCFRILFEGPIGALDLDKTWWVYDELDQLAGTLALSDPKFAQYLPRAYDYWFTHLVDKEFGEVWNNVDGRTHAPVAPKQWEWKNAYHSFEHALVGLYRRAAT